MCIRDSYIAKLINFLNSSASFSLKGFKEVLDSIDGGKNDAMKTEAVPTSVAVQNAIPQNVQKTNVQATPVMPKPAETTYQAPTSSQTNTSVGFQGSVQKPKTPNNIAAPAQSITIPQKSPTMAKPQSSFAVPGKVQPENVSQQTTESSEKPMSMFYLLQHYNKENAAIYKAQKEAKKSGKKQNIQQPQAQPQIQYTQVQQPTSTYNPMPAPNTVVTPAKVPATQVANNSAVSNNVPINNFAPVQQPANMVQPNFGDTTVLSGDNIGDTTVLGSDMGTTYQQAKSAYLVRKKNNERIKITKDVFYIGKELSLIHI